MKSEKLMVINVIKVHDKTIVIPCLTRLSNLFAWLAKNPLKEGIPAFAGMTSKKNSPLWRGVRRTGWFS
jgi:hypothetical protein